MILPVNTQLSIDRDALKKIVKELLLEIEEEKKPQKSTGELLNMMSSSQSGTKTILSEADTGKQTTSNVAQYKHDNNITETVAIVYPN